MNALSALVMTRNEEEMLPGCLESLAWADEILVVDSGSADRTVDIAKAAGARVLFHEFADFSSQLNWGIGQASHDWILVIDADEVVDKRLGEAIRVVLTEEKPVYEIYNIVRDAFFLGKRMRSAAWSNERIPRLFRRGAMTYSGRVHQATETGGRPIGTLDGRLLHYSYRSVDQYFEKMRRYSDLWAKNAYAAGKRIGLPRVFLSSIWRFFHNYLIRGEFVDGGYGLLTAALYAVYTFMKYVKLWGMGMNGK